MFLVAVAIPASQRHRQRDIARRLGKQSLSRSMQPRAGACRDQFLMERRMGAGKGVIEALRIIRRVVRRSRQAVERGNDARFPGQIAGGNCVTQAQRFDLRSDHGQIFEVCCRDGCDAESQLWLRGNQSFGRQSRQCFPHCTKAHGEMLAQIVDSKPLAGLEPTRQQIGA